MTVEDKNFNIKNGLTVGTGKHQVLDSAGRLTANYITLNTGGRYLSAGVDLYQLIARSGVPPLSTNRWNDTYERVLFTGDNWDSVYSWIQSDSGTNNSDYNRNTFVNVSGDVIEGSLKIKEDTYLQSHLRVDGHTYLSAAMYVENDAYVMGNLKVDGDVELAVEGVTPKSIYMGATNDDRVVFRADVDSNIIPDDTITYDLGTSEQQWRELFVHDISASRDIWVDNHLMVSGDGTVGHDFRVSGHGTIEGNTTLSGTLDVKQDTTLDSNLRVSGYTNVEGNLAVSGNTNVEGNTILSGTLDVQKFATFYNDLSVHGDLYVDGNAYLSAGADGVINVGDKNTDNVVFYADVDSNIIPDDTVTYDLGTSEQQWRELFVHDISASRDIWIDNHLMVSGDGTVGHDFRVSGHGTIEGNTTLSGVLDVRYDTTLDNNLRVSGYTNVEGNLAVSANTTVEGNTTLSGVLDVKQDTTLDNNLRVSGYTNVEGNLAVSANTTVEGNTTLSGVLDVRYDTTLDNNLRVSGYTNVEGNLAVSANTTVEGNTTLSGTLDVQDFVTFYNDLSVHGDLYVDGNTYLSAGADGVINVGDKNTDNVVFYADVDSNIIPDDTVTYDLGTSEQQWRELFVHDISASRDVDIDRNLTVTGHMSGVSGLTIAGDTTLSGQLSVTSSTHMLSNLTVDESVHIKGNIVVEGHSYFGFGGTTGQINIGNDDIDEIIFQADVGTHILPYPSITYDLGSLSKRWRTLYIRDINSTGTIETTGDITTTEQIIQTKDYGSGRVVDTKNQIWRATNGSSVANTVSIKTFDSRYQSVKFTIMVKAANGITTTNATFVSFESNVNGTIYGNVTIGTEEPLIDIGCELVDDNYVLNITCKRYSDIMVTGEGMHLS